MIQETVIQETVILETVIQERKFIRGSFALTGAHAFQAGSA